MFKKKTELEQVLRDYGFHGKLVNQRHGPVVTVYEIEPAPGTKGSRIISLADDIARSMSVQSCRIRTIRGHNLIGFEVPNKERQTVFLNDLLKDKTFLSSKAALEVVLGVDIAGQPVFADVAKMPHLLIAGTTGSGKSVGVNAMIISLLTRLSPQQCKMIMIDPKMLELSIYNDIPHLLTPVVTDMSQAVEALQWAVSEMETRYQKMAAASVRNIVNYNSANADEAMPYIVIVIDEVADLMMTAGKDVEFVVQRLAQMARAAGIHVIMATQRPSVDVITGTIKANFPTRISFQVSSKIDSRTILGEGGAEQLLGMGDMLYMKGGGNLTRVHGAFISDADVASFAERLKATQKPAYVDIFGPAPESDPTDLEPSLYEQAKHIVITDNMPKVTYIQRKLGIGYFHASELLEQMEAEGVVSSGGTDRVVLWRPD